MAENPLGILEQQARGEEDFRPRGGFQRIRGGEKRSLSRRIVHGVQHFGHQRRTQFGVVAFRRRRRKPSLHHWPGFLFPAPTGQAHPDEIRPERKPAQFERTLGQASSFLPLPPGRKRDAQPAVVDRHERVPGLRPLKMRLRKLDIPQLQPGKAKPQACRRIGR